MSKTLRRPRVSFGYIEEQVRTVTGVDNYDSDKFRASVILLASSIIGADESAIARFTGYDIEAVREVGQRLRANGVWTDNGMVSADWSEKNGGVIAFVMDAMVGAGMFERSEQASPTGVVTEQATPPASGRKPNAA